MTKDTPQSDPILSDLAALVAEATRAAHHAYAPYSGFRVGAALLLHSGQLVSGANVENVSYGLTICAERAALVRAIAQYGPTLRIRAAAVVNLNHAPSPPCGACRQVLAEFCSPDTLISFPALECTTLESPTKECTSQENAALVQQTRPFSDLLPFAFHLQLKP